MYELSCYSLQRKETITYSLTCHIVASHLGLHCLSPVSMEYTVTKLRKKNSLHLHIAALLLFLTEKRNYYIFLDLPIFQTSIIRRLIYLAGSINMRKKNSALPNTLSLFLITINMLRSHNSCSSSSRLFKN